MMHDVNEARKALEASLSEETKNQYFKILKQWFLFSGSITKLQFDASVRKLMTTQDQLHNHNQFLRAIIAKVTNTRPKSGRSTCDKGCFEIVDFSDYYTPPSPTYVLPSEIENRSAAAELFLPDSGFVSTRIAIASWEHGLEAAEDGVTELLVHACQSFVKNIITAMITRKQGYKLRDKKFQYGFGLPVPDPFIRNTNNIIDNTQESKVEVSEEDDTFIPTCRPSLENAEQQAAFSYLCGKRKYSDGKLTMSLLYETLRENPKIIGLQSVYSINILRTRLALTDD